MGVVAALAIGGLAAGAASGIMGSIGQSQQAEAQYLANKIEVERNNFLSSLDNDRKNFVAARQNAMRRFNNMKIQEAAVEQYSNALYTSRKAFQERSKQLAAQSIQMQSMLTSEATGRNIRGGMVERMKTMASEQAKEARLNNRRQRYADDFNAAVSYENMLNQRDMMSYETANIYMPGSTGVKPGSNTLGMLTAALGGGASGAASGVSIAGGLHQMGKLPG